MGIAALRRGASTTAPGASTTMAWLALTAHVELYIRGLVDRGLMDSSAVSMTLPCCGPQAGTLRLWTRPLPK
jgi:hypothetical protein